MAKKKQAAPVLIPRRPSLPPSLLDPHNPDPVFLPSPELAAWLVSTFIEAGAPLENQRHAHLADAHIGCLLTNVANRSQQRRIVGRAEIPRPPVTGGEWGRGRWEVQLVGWFGQMPDFVLTFDASVLAELDDVTFCSVVEHELCHCAQAVDEFGEPKFHQNGKPWFGILGHDVEEFVEIVERYGVAAAAGEAAALVAAARRKPTIGQASIAAACGNCLAA